MRDISIKPALNGFMVRVGCQRLVFNSKEEMFTELKNYYDFPRETEERLRDRSVNSKNLGYGQAEQTVGAYPEPCCIPDEPERD